MKEYNEPLAYLCDMLMSLYQLDHKSGIVEVFLGAQRCHYQWVVIVSLPHTAEECDITVQDQLDLLDSTASISEKNSPVLVRKCSGLPSWSNDVGDKSAKGSAFVDDADIELEEPGKPTRPKVSGHYDNVGHFPEHSETKQGCKMCHSYVHMKCIKCQCPLCVTKDMNYFLAFQTSPVQSKFTFEILSDTEIWLFTGISELMFMLKQLCFQYTC